MNKDIYNSRVLALLFDDPEARLHMRELARRAGMHPNTVLRDVRLLEGEGLVRTNRTRAVVEVTADRENPLFAKLKRLHNLEAVLLSGLVEELDARYGSPQAIVLFGSYGRGEDTARSDIDIAVVTTRRQRLDLDGYAAALKRPLHVLEVDPKDAGKELLTSLANGVVLKGYLET